MTEKIKKLSQLLIIPVIFLAMYLSLQIVWRVFDLPPQSEVIETIKQYFDRYGLSIVFIGALIEGMLLLGQYFPGGFIIFLGVIAAGSDKAEAALVVSVVSLAFAISYSINYLLGRVGWYLVLSRFGMASAIENAKAKLMKHDLNAIISTYWEPNLASLTATAAGVLRISYKRFLFCSLIGIAIWNSFWGIFVFVLGDNALKIAGPKYILIIFAIWVTVILFNNYVIQNLKQKIAR